MSDGEEDEDDEDGGGEKLRKWAQKKQEIALPITAGHVIIIIVFMYLYVTDYKQLVSERFEDQKAKHIELEKRAKGNCVHAPVCYNCVYRRET